MIKHERFYQFGLHDYATLNQMKELSTKTVKAAILADGHLGYVAPIGSVAGYRNQVSVVGVGFDISCGNCAVKTDITIDKLSSSNLTLADIIAEPSWVLTDDSINDLANEIRDNISFGIGRNNNSSDSPDDHSLFDSDVWDIIPNKNNLRNKLRDKARTQLGTVGSGNHYVDIFVALDGHIWVGVHFGSRGLGHTIASSFISLSQGGGWEERAQENEVLLDLDTSLGQDYWSLMQLAGEYANVGREWVTSKVVQLIGANEIDKVHNHHNFAWKEIHDGEELIVVRKGSTPAFPGQRGFVGGSMGDNAVILEGTKDSRVRETQEAAMFSTVHGAGRVMSRTAAAGKWDRKKKVYKTEGSISQQMMDNWVNSRGVVLVGGGRDEAPQAYRRLNDVLTSQGKTVTVTEQLRPIVVAMAGNDIADPYKD